MPGLMATFADLRLAGVTLTEWMAHHKGASFPLVKVTTFEEWCAKVHVPLVAQRG